MAGCCGPYSDGRCDRFRNLHLHLDLAHRAAPRRKLRRRPGEGTEWAEPGKQERGGEEGGGGAARKRGGGATADKDGERGLSASAPRCKRKRRMPAPHTPHAPRLRQ
jgi:hypothetical protein